MGTPILVIEDVARVHGSGETEVRALDGVSLTVATGELVAVMGPSGSGKSTLLNLAGGLDRATSGTVHVAGTELGSLGAHDLAKLRRRKVGFVFQDLNLIPSLTAAENIGLPLELDGDPVRRARRNALDALDQLGLRELADRYPDQMSGGQQQRVVPSLRPCRMPLGPLSSSVHLTPGANCTPDREPDRRELHIRVGPSRPGAPTPSSAHLTPGANCTLEGGWREGWERAGVWERAQRHTATCPWGRPPPLESCLCEPANS